MAALPGERSRVFSPKMNTVQSRFECSIPREQWYFPPAPPKVPKKPAFDSTDWRALGITAILAATFVATVQIIHQQPPTAQPVAPPMQQPVALAPTPVPTPVPELSAVLPEPPVRRAELATPVYRAELVLPEVRRAEYVGIPVGWQGRVNMPDGHFNVRYMGQVESFDQLPKNPSLGEMWGVAESGHAWVWYLANGFTKPAWVDP